MPITLNTKPGEKLIELGGGGNPRIHPNVDVRQCFDAAGNPTVDFEANFENPLPISSNEFDGCFSQFCLEHISWRKVPQFLKEVLRLLKPGGKVVIITANTEAQMEWIKSHPEGWDGKDSFESFSCVLFGDLDYPENSHKCFMSPAIATKLFQDAGFGNILIRPYGERSTDLVIEAVKPIHHVQEVKMTDQVEWSDNSELCNAIGPKGVTCRLPKGHIGYHRAEV